MDRHYYNTVFAPLVSIVMPAYNAVKYIEETIDCFLNQTYKNIEIIVQDDGSADGTWELVTAKYQANKLVQLYKNEKNLGIGPNWNKACHKASGDYLIVANADDIFSPHMIQKALSIFDTNPVDAVSFNYKRLDDRTNSITDIIAQKNIEEGLQENLFEIVFLQNPYHIIFTVFKSASLKKIELENGDLFVNTQICDTELFFRLGKYRQKLYYSPIEMGYYRMHDTNNSAKPYAEVYSYLYDVLPLYINILEKDFKNRASAHIFNYFLVGELKQSIEKRKLPNFKYMTDLVKVLLKIKYSNRSVIV